MQYPHFYLYFEKEAEISNFSFESKSVPATVKAYLDYDIFKDKFDSINTSIEISKDDAKKRAFKIPFDFYASVSEYGDRNRNDVSLQKKTHYKLGQNEKAQELIDKMNSLLETNVVSFTDKDFKTELSKLNDFCPLKFINYTGNNYSKNNGKLQVKTKYFPDKNEFTHSIEERTDIVFDDLEVSIWTKESPNDFEVWSNILCDGIQYNDKNDYDIHKRTEIQISKKFVPELSILEKVFSMIEEIKASALENKGSSFYKKIEQLPENSIANKMIKNHERFSKYVEENKDIEINKIKSFYESIKDSLEKNENKVEKDSDDTVSNNDDENDYDYYNDIEY